MAVADGRLNCKADAHEPIRNRWEKLSALSGFMLPGPEIAPPALNRERPITPVFPGLPWHYSALSGGRRRG
jgi:hypothetical protein